jgi:hypothetical protein
MGSLRLSFRGASAAPAVSVHIKEDLARGTSVELRQTVLEELAHHLTQSQDFTRDLQDWAFELAVRLAMAVPNK